MKTLRVALALAALVAGCNPGTPVITDGVVLLRWGHLEAKPLGLMGGRLSLGGACVGIEGPADNILLVLWPPNTQLDRSTGALRVVIDGVAFGDGDEVRMGGGEYTDQAWMTSLVGPVPPACDSDRYVVATGLASD